MNILYIGDVMAEPGILAVEKILPELIAKHSLDFVLAQAENVTGGKSMSPSDMQRLQHAGVQAFSGGNHTPSLLDLAPFLEDEAQPVVGPA
ncbi:YmdB family metallophosphoesterase, partial [Candidatus Saccharibacteria bacterium]|nr:YmdB family metallophosphoesterase [Candidatus Saccharibacteria bacterium]